MKKFYAQPITKVMTLNVNAPVCTEPINVPSEQPTPGPIVPDEPLF